MVRKFHESLPPDAMSVQSSAPLTSPGLMPDAPSETWRSRMHSKRTLRDAADTAKELTETLRKKFADAQKVV